MANGVYIRSRTVIGERSFLHKALLAWFFIN
jgi:hypothetical protein